MSGDLMRSVISTLALMGVALLPTGNATAEVQSIVTRVPEAHVKAFQADCKTKDIPDGTCWCVIKTLNETRNGQIVLDLVGLMLVPVDEAARKKEAVAILNRYNLKPSEMIALAKTQEPLVRDTAKACT